MPLIEFHSPHYFWLFAALLVLAFLRGRVGRVASILFSSTAITEKVASQTRSRAGGILFFLRLLALSALIVGLARPRVGQGFTEIESSGIDIILAVDISGSMMARDLDADARGSPLTRLDTVKPVIESFITKRPTDRIGLIVFAGYPYLVSPLTLNHEWLLKNLRENVRIGIIEDGTAIGSAIAMSTNRLKEKENAKSRIIVLLTDGENNLGEIPPNAAAEAAAVNKIRIYAVGAGSDKVVPIYKTDDKGDYVSDWFGRRQLIGHVEPVNDEALKKIAEIAKGRYYRAMDRTQLEAVYDEINSLEKTEVKLRKHQEYKEYFYVPVIVGLLLLLLENVLSNTRLRRLP